MKNPYFTFIAPDNYYAPENDLDPQMLTETLKSFKSAAMGDAIKMNPEARAAAASSIINLKMRYAHNDIDVAHPDPVNYYRCMCGSAVGKPQNARVAENCTLDLELFSHFVELL
jgi:hypothetical protein